MKNEKNRVQWQIIVYPVYINTNTLTRLYGEAKIPNFSGLANGEPHYVN